MRVELDSHADIEVMRVCSHDDAARWSSQSWDDVDLVIVDVFDEAATGEVGADVFAGISILDTLKGLPIRTLAIVPTRGQPLLDLRLFQARVDWVYHRRELNSPDALVAAVRDPSDEHRPVKPAEQVLRELGAVHAQVNELVRTYEDSALYGRIRADAGQKQLGVSRRVSDRLRVQAHRLGFASTEQLSRSRTAHRIARWPDVRDFLLRVLGRKGTGLTDRDVQ